MKALLNHFLANITKGVVPISGAAPIPFPSNTTRHSPDMSAGAVRVLQVVDRQEIDQ
jgi:hypothetical protein